MAEAKIPSVMDMFSDEIIKVQENEENKKQASKAAASFLPNVKLKVTIRMNSALNSKLNALAKKNGMSLNSYVCLVLNKHIEDEETK